MFISNAEHALLITLNEFLPIIVIPDHDNGPEPEEDYAVVSLTTLNKIHRDRNHFYTDPSDGVYKEKIKQDQLIRVTVSFYGDSCYVHAMNSQAYLQLITVQGKLYDDYDFSIGEISSLQRVPEIRDTKSINKAIFDVVGISSFEYAQESDFFTTVVIDSEIQEPDGTIIYTDTDTITYP